MVFSQSKGTVTKTMMVWKGTDAKASPNQVSLCANSEWTHKVVSFLLGNNTDWRWALQISLQKMKSVSWWASFSASQTSPSPELGRSMTLPSFRFLQARGQHSPWGEVHLSPGQKWGQSGLIWLIFQILQARVHSFNDDRTANMTRTWRQRREATGVNSFLSIRQGANTLRYFL